jgi:hypothetical protein
MRNYGSRTGLDLKVPPDQVLTLLIAGSSGQAFDWPTGANIARFTGVSTGGATMNFYVDPSSTKASAPSTANGASSGWTTQGTTGFGFAVHEQDTFQITGGSTGGSVAALSSGYISVEVWKKGG